MAFTYDVHTVIDYPEIQFLVEPPLPENKLQEIAQTTHIPRLTFEAVKQPNDQSAIDQPYSLITIELTQGLPPEQADKLVMGWRRQLILAMKAGWPGIIVNTVGFQEPAYETTPTVFDPSLLPGLRYKNKHIETVKPADEYKDLL